MGGKRKGDTVLIANNGSASPSALSTSSSHHQEGVVHHQHHRVSPTNHQTSHTTFTDFATTTINSKNKTTSNILPSQSPAWLDSASLDHKLWVVRQTLKLEDEINDNDDDDFLVQVQQCRDAETSITSAQQSMQTTSQRLQDNLIRKIQQEEEKCQEESALTLEMERTCQLLNSERKNLTETLSELAQTRQHLSEKIVEARREANQQVEQLGGIEEARKNQVPKLKHQISMDANTTGLKWNFEKEHLLEGEVVRVLASFLFDFV